MSPVWAGGQVPCLLVRRRVDGAGQPRAAPRCPAGVCFAVAGPALRDPHSPLFLL